MSRRLVLAAALVTVMNGGAAAKPGLRVIPFMDLPGWAEDAHGSALEAFRRSCAEIVSEGRAFGRPVRFGGTRKHWLEVCAKIPEDNQARRFFEENFTALEVIDESRPEGLFTGYYEPEVEGSLVPTPEFHVPVYGRPPDLRVFNSVEAAEANLAYGRIVAGRPQAYFTRQEIETGALEGRGLEIAWLRDWADAYFIQVQGSGRVRLPDGRILRLAYALKTGLPYTSIGAVLAERGVLSRDAISMQSIRAWMAANPEEGRHLMWENKSFVFFRMVEVNNAELGPPGAQQVALTPGRSMAVDRRIWVFGTPIWLDTTIRGTEGAETFRRLLIAQDTGSAITGPARGDVFWGAGEDAALIAGRMKSPGRMVVLLPRALAAEIVAQP